jgi:hypothetical protein
MTALQDLDYDVRPGSLYHGCRNALAAFGGGSEKVAFALLLFPCLVSPEVLAALRALHPSLLVVTYNWDEPYAWNPLDVVGNRMHDRAKHVDVALSCSRAALALHTQNGTAVARHANPYARTHDVLPNENVYNEEDLQCDVVFLCTNYYASDTAHPNQVVNRRTLLEALGRCCADNGLTFHLYGPPANVGQDNAPPGITYRGSVRQDGISDRACLARARVCLNTHVVRSDGYFNERTGICMSAGAVMLVDAQEGLEDFLTPGQDCLTYDSATEACDQILRICLDTAKEERCRIRHEAVRTAERHFSGTAFVANVLAAVREHKAASAAAATDQIPVAYMAERGQVESPHTGAL